ncbi:MAG: hypothetical protein U1D55_16465 [Phycisphaerae bacterium]
MFKNVLALFACTVLVSLMLPWKGGGSATAAQDASAPGVAAAVQERPDDSAERTPPTLAPTRGACLIGVSKNLCQGILMNGVWHVNACGNAGTVACRTLEGTGAILSVQVLNNGDGCLNVTPLNVPCDESPTLSGPMVALVDMKLRLGTPCQTRGFWNGAFNLSGSVLPVVIASGTMEGTAGVGTDRPVRCLSTTPTPTCGSACETCAASRFDATNGRWSIPVEGVVRGRVMVGPHAGCMLRLTLSGTLDAPVAATGPIPPDQLNTGWFFCGAMDGMLECACTP